MHHLDDGELTAYLDGQLTPGSRPGSVEPKEHLATCAECQTRLEAMRVTRERATAILRSGTPSGAQPSFQAIQARRRAARSAPARPRLSQLRSLAWAATVVLALSVGWYVRELQLRPSAPQSVELTAQAPETDRLVVDTAPKLAARQAPVIRAPRQVAARPAGVAGEVSARAKETANVVAERKDEPAAATPVKLAAEAPTVQPSNRPTVEEVQLKKLNARDTMPLNLDAVVVTGVGERSARTRQAGAASVAAPAPVSGRAEARGLADAPAATAEWTRVDVSAATRVLDRAPFIAPGLAVLEYQVNAGRTSVRVIQRLNTGILELIQQRAGVKEESGPSASRAVTGPGFGALVDGIQLRLWGPVSYDSLRALVAKLK